MPSVNIYLYLSPGLKFFTYTMYHVMWLGWMTSSSFVPLQTVLAPCSFVQSLDKLIYSEALPLVELRQTPTKLQSSSGLCQFFGCLRRRGGLKPYLAGVAADPAADHPAAGGGAEDVSEGHQAVGRGAEGQSQPVRSLSLSIGVGLAFQTLKPDTLDVHSQGAYTVNAPPPLALIFYFFMLSI